VALFQSAAFGYAAPRGRDAGEGGRRALLSGGDSGRDSEACDRLLAEDFVHNGEARGREGQKAAVEYFLAAFSDLEHEVLLILGEDDLVAAHQRWAGTHGGEFLGFAPTGRRVEFTSTAIIRVADGLIAEAWDELDSGQVAAQLRPTV
jgi:predicted ester cyclase